MIVVFCLLFLSTPTSVMSQQIHFDPEYAPAFSAKISLPSLNAVNKSLSQSEKQMPLCVYHHLLLIYPESSVEYIENGFVKRFYGRMSESLVLKIVSAFKYFAENLVRDGSGGIVMSTYNIIVVDHPVTAISSYDSGYYWLSPENVETDLAKYASEGRYDSVFVVWYSGPIKTYWGVGGLLINDGGTIFSSIVSGEESWWIEPESSGQVFLHEWLHGVARFFQGLGYIMPEGDADGAERYGYVWTPEEGWMAYYRDLMQGRIWDPRLSRFVGIPLEAWSEYCSPNIVKLMKIGELYQQLYQLQTNYDSLSRELRMMRDQLDSLQNDYIQLQDKYNQLLSEYQQLRDENTRLTTEYVNLERDHEQLLGQYNSLQESYQSISEELSTTKGTLAIYVTGFYLAIVGITVFGILLAVKLLIVPIGKEARIISLLARLEELRQRGVISQDEYEKKVISLSRQLAELQLHKHKR